ncbi:MAG: SURF1 family protein [Pseudomonadota bacterium]
MTERLRFIILPTVFALCVLPVLLALGTWQLKRLAWKEDLIRTVTERPTRDPVPAPGPEDWTAFDFSRYDYLPVNLTGRFGEDEVHVYTALSTANGPLSGQGYWVVTPFEASDGWTVIVNRGFIPDDRKDQQTRPNSVPPMGSVTLTGLIRRPGTGNRFTPDADPDANIWYARDPAAIGAHFGVQKDRLAPYSIDLAAAMTPEGGLPQAGETLMRFSNNHLQYAVTWYGLALTLVGVYGAFIWGRLKRRREGDA